MKLNGSGYVDVVLSNNGKTERLHIHRLVANAFIDNPDNKKQVNHIDYNRTNNAVSNLEWCSAKENMAHSAHRMKKPKKIRTHIPLSGHRYISKIGNRYRVQIQTLNVCERFSTIEEALAYRDKVISENDWR